MRTRTRSVQLSETAVPRDGIEPPTRGFSILTSRADFADVLRRETVYRSRTEAAAGNLTELAWRVGKGWDGFHRVTAGLRYGKSYASALAAAAIALAGCGDVRVDAPEASPPPATYVAEQDEPTPPGAHQVRAVAACDPGDRALAGGCSWGEVEDAHDPPLRPLADRPTDAGDGWECIGQNTGVGASLKTLRASAVCQESDR